mgnify:CR=1 FL=1
MPPILIKFEEMEKKPLNYLQYFSIPGYGQYSLFPTSSNRKLESGLLFIGTLGLFLNQYKFQNKINYYSTKKENCMNEWLILPDDASPEEFLVKREKGEVEEADTDLKYFVIGGSFIVPKNASDFSNTLDAQGFDSRILFHPGTRFNYVAYYAFSNYDEAVETTKRMRKEGDPGTWLFTLEPEIEFKNDN